MHFKAAGTFAPFVPSTYLRNNRPWPVNHAKLHPMEFNLMEKLAVIKAVDEVIQIDEEVKKGEEKFMNRLSEALAFDEQLLAEARRVEAAEALAVLRAMPGPLKQALARLLNEAANADGEVDEREIRFIYRICAAAGIEVDI